MTIDVSAVARVLGIDTQFKDLRDGGIMFLPQRVAVIGQGTAAATYATTKFTATSAAAVGAATGYGGPLHLAARQIFPSNGDGVGTIPVDFFPLAQDGSGAVSTGSITPSGTQTEAASYYVLVNNIASTTFTIAASATVAARTASITAAINAVLEMPIIAVDNSTAVAVTSKWKGVSANDIVISVVGASLGTTFTIVQPVGGLVNPAITAATAQFGNVWYTLVVNCMNSEDTTTLGALATLNETRWGELVRRPFVAFAGNTDAAVATAYAVPNARPTDRTNCQITAPGSNELPMVLAARGVAKIARIANNNPPTDYGMQRLTGLTPGADGSQWDFATRDLAVKSGCSTTEIKDGEIVLCDTITFYKPTGQPVPAYRYVVDIIKLQNIIYNLDLIFNQPEWAGAPLIPDDQPTTNPNARKPKSAKAAVCKMLDGLGLAAIISDPETAKENTVASINSMNPKRLDVQVTVQLSGNTEIIAVALNFGFFFGEAALAA